MNRENQFHCDLITINFDFPWNSFYEDAAAPAFLPLTLCGPVCRDNNLHLFSNNTFTL